MERKDIIMPNYDHCILGTISSILKYYNVETKHKTSEKLDQILNEKQYKNVIFLVLDGLGEHILNPISPDGYLKKHQIDLVTSVYPSTTTAALTTYYSGNPPFETGWIAWSQYFKEYGRALDMFSHNESYMREPLKKPLMDVYKTIMNYESVFEKIESASPDVKAYEIEPEYAERRALRSIDADNIDELLMNIEDLCNLPNRKFILAYCDNPDGLLHKYGTTSEEVKTFVKDTENKLEEMCNNFDDDTILIISADHGHKDIEKAYTLLDYPEIQECLIMPAYLESRVLTFWVKENMRNEFVERFNKVFENEFWLMTREEFLDKYHFLGYGEKHKKIDDFIGNYMALSTAGSMIRLETFLAEGKPVKKSTHCGLTKEEMEVPVFVIKK
ncbi:MAG: alkaline phosphatase family protein [Clostridia bacterium]|nr:alkaline phosphatase family protein [Clostridia bacterium]